MKKETGETRKTRAAEINRRLKKTYLKANIALRFKNPWELLVAVILSAQCTDKVVNRVTEKLYKKYRTTFASGKKTEVMVRKAGCHDVAAKKERI